MRIAITGASGLLGSNLAVCAVKAGFEVVCTRRQSSKVGHLNHVTIQWCTAELADVESLCSAFREVEVVFHCAARVGYGRVLRRELYRSNVVGTENVIEAVRREKVGRLVHVSSVDALGLPEHGLVADERTTWNWDERGLDFGYPRTKYESQKLVLKAASEGLDAVVVSPTFMIGPLDSKPSSGRLVLSIAKGRGLGYPDGMNNFVDVRDVCEGILLASKKGKSGEVYILGGENLSYRDMFTAVAKCAGVRAPVVRLPRVLARTAGVVGDMVSFVSRKEVDVNSETARLGYISHVFSSEKAERELGYTARPIGEAITASLEWFRSSALL